MTRWHSVTSGVLARQLGDLADHARRGPDAQDDAELVAERARVDVGAVAADDAGLLEPREPLADGRSGQPDAPAELGEAEPRVVLQRLDQLAIGRVELLIRKSWRHDAFDRHCTAMRSGMQAVRR